MPKISKQLISKYIKTDCKKFLALSLYRNRGDRDNVKKYGMPEPIVARPATVIFATAGKRAEELVYDLIEEEFDQKVVNFKKDNVNLLSLFHNGLDGKLFLLEAEFATDDILEIFFNKIGLSTKDIKDKLDLADIRPDIITKVKAKDSEIYYEVLSDGTLKQISKDDNRIKLSIIDVKNSEKSNSGFDAEVVLYAILLSIWLEEKNLSDKYVVTSKSGIFPAALKVDAFTEAYEPLKGDSLSSKYDELISYIEYIEFDQIVIALRRIFIEDIIPILREPEKWEELDWHIGKKCGMCDWLAYETWLSDSNKQKITNKHCYIKAENSEHISQIPFVTSAMRKVLQDSTFYTISDIQKTDGTENVYLKHSKLKVDSSIIPKRADAILRQEKNIENRLIYSIPKGYSTFTSIFITLNFDPSTRIVSSISTKCYWKEYTPYEEREVYNRYKNYPAKVFFTDEGDIEHERKMLFLFLKELEQYFSFANDPQNNRHPLFRYSNYHMYFWDRTQYDELRNLIGRHMGVILENSLFKPLIWLFGTEDILEDYRKIKSANVTFLKDVIKSNLALGLKFDYTLFEVAQEYTDFNKRLFKAFYDPFSDYIPKERLYEIWLEIGNYQDTKDNYRLTAKAQVEALQFIAIQLHKDLKPLIKGEPTDINFDIFNDFKNMKSLPVDSKLWYLHQRLNEEFDKHDKELDSFNGAKELEASYKAIILNKPLWGIEKNEWLKAINLDNGDNYFVYKVTEDSKTTKIKDTATNLSVGINDDPSFIIKKIGAFARENALYDIEDRYLSKRMGDEFQVNIVHFDRIKGIITIKENPYRPFTKYLLDNGIINMNQKLYLLELDSYTSSRFTLQYLKAIKTPLVSHADKTTIRALGLTKDISGKKTHPDTMAADVLWDAKKLQNELSEFSSDLIEVHYSQVIGNLEREPNDRQKDAIVTSLRKKLSIIWGPPGTGKTHTASILLKTLLSILTTTKKPKNILISAFTYQACVELFEKLYPKLDESYKEVEFYLLSSASRNEFSGFPDKAPDWMNLSILNKSEKLREKINDQTSKVIISPISQLNSLYNDREYKDPQFNHIGEYIDFALLDEASQCDVANSLGVLYGLKKASQLVILGDHLQMPPIHKVKPPINLEYNVGSLLDYLRNRHEVKPIMLNVNYRSTQDIVKYISSLGYEDLIADRDCSTLVLSDNRLVDNPHKDILNNNSLLEEVFLLENEVAAISYSDGVSSQANLFEATLVAANIVEAYNRFYNNQDIESYNEWFWGEGVGIVTPHKAQKALISRLLYEVFPEHKYYIDDAIDTVERFQGGQRKFIIVSFGVGDPDIIIQEEEFLLNLNRTNVAISRAEDKVLVLISDELVHHLPDDKGIIKTSKAIKNYVHQYCLNAKKYSVNFEYGKREVVYRVHKN